MLTLETRGEGGCQSSPRVCPNREWLRHLKRRLRKHHPDVAALLALAEPDDALDGGRLEQANEWVAKTVIDFIDQDKIHTANFLRSTRSPTPPSNMQHGLLLLKAIEDQYVPLLGAEKRDAQIDFDAYHPFQMGMKAEQAQKAAEDLIALFKRLPADTSYLLTCTV